MTLLAATVAASPCLLLALTRQPAREWQPPAAVVEARRAPSTLVLITIDTLRADHLGCYGYGRDTSPAIDALAREGQVYDRFLAQAPSTHPSLATMMTGAPLNAFDHLATRDFVPPDARTIALSLSERGYTTVGVVSNPWIKTEMGFSRGFDRFDDQSAMVGSAADVTDAALAAIDDVQGDLFLWVHYLDPHHPYLPPPPHDTMFGPPLPSIVELQRQPDLNQLLIDAARGKRPMSEAEWARLTDLYDGEIRYTDQEVGRLLEALGDMGRLDDARVVVTSDHGEEFRDHGGVLHSHTLFAELIRLPLIVWESEGQARSRRSEPIAARTVGNLLLIGQAPEAPYVLSEKLDDQPGLAHPLVSVRSDRHTLIAAAYRPYWFGLRPRRLWRSLRDLVLFAAVASEYQLFSADDLSEATPLDDDRALAAMQAALRELYRAAAIGTATDHRPSAQTIEQLRGLGYLGDSRSP